MKKLINKEFCLYVLFKTLAQLFIIFAVYNLFLIGENISISIVLFVLGIFINYKISIRKEKLELTTCLDDSNLILRNLVPIFMIVGLAFLALNFINDTNEYRYLTFTELMFLSFGLLIVGISLYIYQCKKKEIL